MSIFNLVVVAEQHDPVEGVDLIFRRVLNYTLRSVITCGQDPTKPYGDWPPAVIADRVSDPTCGFVVVVLDEGKGPNDAGDLGPKCFAAVQAAQTHNKPYILLLPFVRYRHIVEPTMDAVACADAEGQAKIIEASSFRFSCGDESLRMPVINITMSFDCLIAEIMAVAST
jgi:hypothetical protein